MIAISTIECIKVNNYEFCYSYTLGDMLAKYIIDMKPFKMSQRPSSAAIFVTRRYNTIETDMTSVLYDVNVVFAPFPYIATLLRVDAIGPVCSQLPLP